MIGAAAIDGYLPSHKWLREPHRYISASTAKYVELHPGVGIRINSPVSLLAYVADSFVGFPYERFGVVLLGPNHEALGLRLLGEGSAMAVVVDKQDLVRTLAFTGATSAILIHNHSGQTVEPSAGDDRLTEQVRVLCEASAVALIEHLIIGAAGMAGMAGMGSLRCYSYRARRSEFLTQGLPEAEVTFEDDDMGWKGGR